MNSQAKSVVLVLEDYSAVRVLYQDLLSVWGYEVIAAPSMKGALQLFNEERPRIVGVISDGDVVEGEFGPIFVEAIRRMGFTGPIVAASMSKSLMEKLVKAGCDLQAHDKGEAPQVLHQAIQSAQTRPT